MVLLSRSRFFSYPPIEITATATITLNNNQYTRNTYRHKRLRPIFISFLLAASLLSYSHSCFFPSCAASKRKWQSGNKSETVVFLPLLLSSSILLFLFSLPPSFYLLPIISLPPLLLSHRNGRSSLALSFTFSLPPFFQAWKSPLSALRKPRSWSPLSKKRVLIKWIFFLSMKRYRQIYNGGRGAPFD